MKVIITGIKSLKTLNTIKKDLDSWYLGYAVSGSVGNFQITVHNNVFDSPDKVLEFVIGCLRNLTPEHISNLKWTVKK